MTGLPTVGMSPPGDIELAVFERREGERLVVSWRQYEGHHFVDLRVQFRAEDGRWLPTKKGVTIKLRELHNVHDALTQACELAAQVRR
jgi:hypothetical protein